MREGAGGHRASNWRHAAGSVTTSQSASNRHGREETDARAQQEQPKMAVAKPETRFDQRYQGRT